MECGIRCAKKKGVSTAAIAVTILRGAGTAAGAIFLHQTLISNLNVGYGEDKVVDHRQNLSGVGLAKFKTRRVLNYQSRLNRFEALVEEEHQKRDQVDFGFEAHLLKHCGRW